MLAPLYQDEFLEAGCDEAGRGCLAGPVFAAAVILPKDFAHPLLNDSKQIKEKDRFKLRLEIEQAALAFAVGVVSHQEIDKINNAFNYQNQMLIFGNEIVTGKNNLFLNQPHVIAQEFLLE